jgi:hypothetical protein
MRAFERDDETLTAGGVLRIRQASGKDLALLRQAIAERLAITVHTQ